MKIFLTEQEIEINQHDQLNQSADAPIKDDMELSVNKAFEVELTVGKEKSTVWTTATTVSDLLENQDVTLNELDKVNLDLAEEVQKGTAVNVVRVEKITDVEVESLAHETVTKKDSTMKKGAEKVVTKGANGSVSKQYEITKENGKIVSKELISEKVTEQPVNEVVAVGTKKQSSNVTTLSTSNSGGKSISVSATAYTASCSGCSGITKTGINLHSNPSSKVIAVDPSVIPLGSRVYVEGYGTAIAADTGSGINGYEIDVFFPAVSDAYRWGVRTVKVTILD